MTNTKIEWCTKTWDPIVGCLHDCEYCYARKKANRFTSKLNEGEYSYLFESRTKLPKHEEHGIYGYDLHRACVSDKGKAATFPAAFIPTFHRYRLGEPAKIKKPQTIFVGSMADMFGGWIPNEWLEAVFKVCKDNPQHRYLFLTKNQYGYVDFHVPKISRFWNNLNDNFWYGTTLTCTEEFRASRGKPAGEINRFISIEPLLGSPEGYLYLYDIMHYNWVIIGAMTGRGAKNHTPKKEWIENIVTACKEASIPVFLKDNLISICGEEYVKNNQQFPWQL